MKLPAYRANSNHKFMIVCNSASGAAAVLMLGLSLLRV